MSSSYRGRGSSSSWRPSGIKSKSDGSGRRRDEYYSGNDDNDHEGHKSYSNYGRGSPAYNSNHRDRGTDHDAKIAAQSRILARTETEETFKKSCRQIMELLEHEDNKKYMIKYFNLLEFQFCEAFKNLNLMHWKESGIATYGKLISCFFNAMGSGCNTISNWLVDYILKNAKSSKYSTVYIIRDVILKAIPFLSNMETSTLTSTVQEAVENADDPSVFRILCSIYVAGLLHNKETKSSKFQDFIDILIGWMTDENEDELGDIYLFCFAVIQQLEMYFKRDTDFAINLLFNIVDELLEHEESKVKPSLPRLIRLVKACEAILTLGISLDKATSIDLITRIITSLEPYFTEHCTTNPDAVSALIGLVNQCFSLTSGVDGEPIRSFFKMQLSFFNNNTNWGMDLLITFLMSTSTWIETISQQTQLDEEVLNICEELMCINKTVQPILLPCNQIYLVRIAHGLLRSRCIHLLHKCYAWILDGIKNTDDGPHLYSKDANKILFALSALTDIGANMSGSILSLWALNPPIIDVTTTIIKESSLRDDFRVRHCALLLLKSHCLAHSHFVSSMISTKTFLADSPAQKYFHTLMSFWTDMIPTANSDLLQWLFDWVSKFLESSSSYISIVITDYGSFYKKILNQFSHPAILHEPLGSLLKNMANDPCYLNCEHIVEVIREICVRLVLDGTVKPCYKDNFSFTLSLLPCKLVLTSEFIESVLPSVDSSFEQDTCPENLDELTNVEFDNFLQCLFAHSSNSSDTSVVKEPHRNLIKSAVIFLIRSKLKTSIGKAPDFFGQLQLVFRRLRNSKPGTNSEHRWKLYFVYELQKRILHCAEQSAFFTCDMPEPTRAFYVKNKTPCIEMIKRVSPDLIDVSLELGEYSIAYFFSIMAGDEVKAKISLLELYDKEGLQGMTEIAGFHYLNDDYERCKFKLSSTSNDSSVNPFNQLLNERIDTIFREKSAWLEKWPNSIEQNLQPQIITGKIPLCRYPTVLSVQVESIPKGSRIISLKLMDTDIYTTLNVPELIALEDIFNKSKTIDAEYKHKFEHHLLDRMVEHGNLKYARNWLSERNFNPKIIESNYAPEIIKLIGDMMFKEANFSGAATTYAKLYNLLLEDSDLETPLISNDFKAASYLSFAEKIKESSLFYDQVFDASPVVANMNGINQTIQTMLEKARESSRSSSSSIKADALFLYASFVYHRSESENLPPILMDVFRSNSSHSFANFIKWSKRQPEFKRRKGDNTRIITAMTRLIDLYKQGHKFIPEDLVTSDLWLKVLPQLAKIEEIRPYLLRQFPHHSYFLIATLEYAKQMKRFENRRGVFDPSVYSFTEATEEPFQSQCSKYCGKDMEEAKFPSKNSVDYSYNEIDTEKLLNYKTVVKEIERVGTTKEEFWASATERIRTDWLKRVNTLRKDLARDKGENISKVKAYVSPVLTFLQLLWERTCKGDTPAELSFVVRYGEKIKDFIARLDFCTDSEQLGQICQDLAQFVQPFESFVSSKLSLSNMSPVLYEFSFNNNKHSISLPGFRPGVTVVSINQHITCLATKTKPKRISMRGSDGKQYDYLVKGNENLSVDAGIMQLLRVIQEIVETPTRHYCVTPIGERGGLIQIVENAQPLFLIYKKYLQRSQKSLKPSELFWSRLQKLGFTDRSNLDGLKEAFKELRSETPNELISRDLYLCAEDPKSWYKSVQTFTKDCALGSALCHTVGVGDRHLDNILINLKAGHLIHVDFSVLFGKGASLKVPERVPFRLTQNIAAALQYPGIKGSFTVYLDEFLQQFQTSLKLVMFCVAEIAAASVVEEGLPIDPEVLLLSEVRAALELLRVRIGNVGKIIQTQMKDILEAVGETKSSSVWNTKTSTSTDNLKRKLFRWRRLLANLDPIIQFIKTNTQPTASLKNLHQIVNESWTVPVMHFWSHTPIDQLIPLHVSIFSEKLRLTELTIQKLVSEIPMSPIIGKIDIEESVIVHSGEQKFDQSKILSTIKIVEKRIETYSTKETASSLIESATSEENLSQMYEGWTAWV